MDYLYIILGTFFLLWIIWRLIRVKIQHAIDSINKTDDQEEEKLTLDDHVTRIPSDEEKLHEKDKDKEEIIDISKPLGYWTERIFQQELPKLLARMEQEKGGMGYWQSLVSKQRGSRGKGGKNGGDMSR